MTVVIGIDPHKTSHTATAIGPGSVEAVTIRLRAARLTPEELLSWAARWPERRWAIEGVHGLGRPSETRRAPDPPPNPGRFIGVSTNTSSTRNPRRCNRTDV